MRKVRCVWCAASWNIEDLTKDEQGRPAYCPVCKHADFDDRYFANFVSAIFLQPTWNANKYKEVEEGE